MGSNRRPLFIADPNCPEAVAFLSSSFPVHSSTDADEQNSRGKKIFRSLGLIKQKVASESPTFTSREHSLDTLIAEGKILLVPMYLKGEWERACRLNSYKPGLAMWDIVTSRFFYVIRALLPNVHERLACGKDDNVANYVDDLIHERFLQIIIQLRIDDERRRGLAPQDVTVRPQSHLVRLRRARQGPQDR